MKGSVVSAMSLKDCVRACRDCARFYSYNHCGRSKREKKCLANGYLVERLDDGKLHLLGISKGGLFVMR